MLLRSELHREVAGVAGRRRRRVSAGVLGRAVETLLRQPTRRARGDSNQRSPHIRRTSLSKSTFERKLSDVRVTTFKLRLYDITCCQTGCQTGLTTGWMFVYTMQPVVQPVVQPV